MLPINSHTCTCTLSNQLWHRLEERCRIPVFWSLLSLLYAVCAISPIIYHWRELPQVSFLSRQTRVCWDKTRLLSRQNYACRDKTFVATKLCLSQQNIVVATTVFVATKVCRYKSKLVATKMILVAAPVCDNYPPPRSYFNLGPWGHLRTEHLPSLSNPSLIKTEYKIKEHFKSKSLA